MEQKEIPRGITFTSNSSQFLSLWNEIENVEWVPNSKEKKSQGPYRFSGFGNGLPSEWNIYIKL